MVGHLIDMFQQREEKKESQMAASASYSRPANRGSSVTSYFSFSWFLDVVHLGNFVQPYKGKP
jgi:hypothetical protein